MRISDWSSDVCSSDLQDEHRFVVMQRQRCRHRPLFPPDHDRAQIIMRRERTMQIAGIKGRASEPRVVPGHIAVEESVGLRDGRDARLEAHTSELQSLIRISYVVFCLKKNTKILT